MLVIWWTLQILITKNQYYPGTPCTENQRHFEVLDASDSQDCSLVWHLATSEFPKSDSTVAKLSADAGSLWNTIKQVFLSPICLDYRAYNRPASSHNQMTMQQKFQGSACFLPIIGQLSAMDITKLYCDWSKDDQKVETFCYIVFIQSHDSAVERNQMSKASELFDVSFETFN